MFSKSFPLVTLLPCVLLASCGKLVATPSDSDGNKPPTVACPMVMHADWQQCLDQGFTLIPKGNCDYSCSGPVDTKENFFNGTFKSVRYVKEEKAIYASLEYSGCGEQNFRLALTKFECAYGGSQTCWAKANLLVKPEVPSCASLIPVQKEVKLLVPETSNKVVPTFMVIDFTRHHSTVVMLSEAQCTSTDTETSSALTNE